MNNCSWGGDFAIVLWLCSCRTGGPSPVACMLPAPAGPGLGLARASWVPGHRTQGGAGVAASEQCTCMRVPVESSQNPSLQEQVEVWGQVKSAGMCPAVFTGCGGMASSVASSRLLAVGVETSSILPERPPKQRTPWTSTCLAQPGLRPPGHGDRSLSFSRP